MQNPFIYPDISPPSVYDFSGSVFDDMINRYGVSLYWMKSHNCACIESDGFNPDGTVYSPKGSPNPSCSTCSGRGTYWDEAFGPFTALISYIGTPDSRAPGTAMDSRLGNSVYSNPALTIPSGVPVVWEQASLMDAFVESGTDTRFNSTLTVGQDTILPYRYSVNVLGVTVYDHDTDTTVPVPSGSYTVSGANVVLSGYAAATPYIVDYIAWPIYIAYGLKGGIPHNRPFLQNLTYPKRFSLQLLDIYLRNTGGGLDGNL